MSAKLVVNIPSNRLGNYAERLLGIRPQKARDLRIQILDRESLGLEGSSGSLKLTFSVVCCAGQLTGKMVNLGKRMRRLKPV
jgi:hypothetical protein